MTMGTWKDVARCFEMSDDMGRYTVSPVVAPASVDVAVYEKLRDGDASVDGLCWDGTPFFNEQHPGEYQQSNLLHKNHGHDPWIALALQNNAALFPMIVAQVGPAVAGNHRYHVGYGAWHRACMSKGPINKDTMGAVLCQMENVCDDRGRSLQVRVSHIVTFSDEHYTNARRVVNDLLLESIVTVLRAPVNTKRAY